MPAVHIDTAGISVFYGSAFITGAAFLFYAGAIRLVYFGSRVPFSTGGALYFLREGRYIFYGRAFVFHGSTVPFSTGGRTFTTRAPVRLLREGRRVYYERGTGICTSTASQADFRYCMDFRYCF